MKFFATPQMLAVIGASTIAFSLSAPRAAADDSKKLGSEVKESAMANDFSKFLKPFRKIRARRGHTVKWWISPDADPVECKGSGNAKWIHENRVISQTIKGTWLGASFEATVLFTYDNTLSRYTCTWLDTLSNRMLFFSGKPQEGSETLELTGQTGNALTRQPVQLRCVVQLPDRAGILKTVFYRTDTGGTEYKFMEVVSKKPLISAG